MQSVDVKLLIKINKAKRGELFFTKDFLAFGTGKAVAKALERSVKKRVVVQYKFSTTIFSGDTIN